MFSRAKIVWAVAGLVIIAAGIGLWLAFWQPDGRQPTGPVLTEPEPEAPQLQIYTAAEGYSHIWDLVFVDGQTAVFSERAGRLHGIDSSSGETWQIAELNQVRANGEGGLLGLALDTDFADNRFGYVCYNAFGSSPDVRVARFRLAEDGRSISGLIEIVTDIQSQGGRHSGCRLHMDAEGVLWVATGDSAIGDVSQNPGSLAGKVLRVNRDGQPAAGNLGAPFDPRIFSYGHRNVQGLVVFDEPLPNGARGFTAEHGPDRDDEINWLLPGNFGWNPDGAGSRYDESVPMTDTDIYPDARESIWRSGSPTIAPSGIARLTSARWGLWQGRLAMATLKGRHVRLLDIDDNGTVRSQQELLDNFGRIRTAREAPNGDLYITTDNGDGQDKIIRIIPE